MFLLSSLLVVPETSRALLYPSVKKKFLESHLPTHLVLSNREAGRSPVAPDSAQHAPVTTLTDTNGSQPLSPAALLLVLLSCCLGNRCTAFWSILSGALPSSVCTLGLQNTFLHARSLVIYFEEADEDVSGLKKIRESNAAFSGVFTVTLYALLRKTASFH